MPNVSRLSLAGISVLGLACQAFAPSARAQAPDQATVADQGLEEIVVTARRKDELLQDVPITVNAVKAETLADLQERNFTDVAALVPGLTLTPATDGVAPAATLRGVNYDVNTSGSNGTVDFYLNDAPITAGALFQSMYDIGQIEVLHGPQGTLRGLASPSGSVTVTTRRPDLEEIGGYANGTVSGTASNSDGLNINGAFNLPLIKGILALRVAAVRDDSAANLVHSINDPAFQPYADTKGIRSTLRFDPVDSVDIQASYEHLSVRTRKFDQVESANLALGLPPVGAPLTADERESVEYTPRTIAQDYDTGRLQGAWRFAGQALNYVGGFAAEHIDSQYVGNEGDTFPSPVPYPGNANANPVASANIYNFGQYTDVRSTQFSSELRLSSEERVLGMFDYVVGGLINRANTPTNLTAQGPIFAATPPSPATLFGFYAAPVQVRSHTHEGSIFGNATLHLGDKLEISGGLRRILFDNFSNLSISPGGVDDFKATIYSASANYHFTDNLMAYFSTGSSWRVGSDANGVILGGSGQPENTVTDPRLAALYAFTPETSKSYEVGFKSEWFERKLLANLTAYYQTFHNYIYSTPVLTFNANIGTLAAPVYEPSVTGAGQSGLAAGLPVRVQGLEGEVAYRFSRHFDVDAVFSYSESKIKNGQVPCNIYNGAGQAILPAPPAQLTICPANYSAGLSAPFTATLQSEYTQPVTARADAFIRGLTSIYGNSQNQPLNPYDNIGAYAVVNAYLGIRDPHGVWEVTGYMKNLFNTQRVLSREENQLATSYATFTGGGAAISNYRLVTTTPSQEIGVNLIYSFGSR